MAKAQQISIDLNKNPDVADVVRDLAPGQFVELQLSVVHKDDQTVVLEIEEVDVGAESEEVEEDESPAPSPAEDASNGITPDE